jgi:hypothetical protein
MKTRGPYRAVPRGLRRAAGPHQKGRTIDATVHCSSHFAAKEASAPLAAEPLLAHEQRGVTAPAR